MPVVALLGHGVARRGREEGGRGAARRRGAATVDGGAVGLLGEGEGRTRRCSEQMGKKKEV